jgi:MFS family permease
LIDRVDPRVIAQFGLVMWIAGVLFYVQLVNVDTSLMALLAPNAVMGLGSACVWGPISTTATRKLPPQRAGAGAGIYNTTRQIGQVLGSASMAALLQARIAAHLGGGGAAATGASGRLPSALQPGFSAAMAESMLMPALALGLGAVAVSFFVRPQRSIA